jgi:hypothetical protein
MNKVNQSICLYFAIPFALLMLTAEVGFGQAPGILNYQAVLRNGSGDLLSNTNATVEVMILEGSATGSEVYSETHSVTSNTFGLLNFEIGAEDPIIFSSINWANGPYFIKIVVDGNQMGTSQLLSVPYALYAENVAGSPGPKGDTGPQGPKGDSGDTGSQGLKGDKGDTGILGATGDKGQQGIRGDKGDTGSQGLKGDKGDIGLQGSKGDKGDTGAQGPKGDKGDTGLQGTKGDIGDTGPRGPNGYTGPTGPARCIAFGCVLEDGTISSGSGNFTCTWDASNSNYKIKIGGEEYFYASFATIVTPAYSSILNYCFTDSADGNLLITMISLKSKLPLTGSQSVFHFAVFKY